MGRGPGIPLEIKQAIAQIFDEFGNTKKARREARNFHSKARPGFNQLSHRTLTHIYNNRREFLAMQNLPVHKRNKRKNLKKKGALDDFKLEPIDDVDAAPDVKIEVFEIEGSNNIVHDGTEMIIEEIGTADVKIEVLEINTAEAESEENEFEDEQTAKLEEHEESDASKRRKAVEAFEKKNEFYIPAQLKSDVFDDVETDTPEVPCQFEKTEIETRTTHQETSSPQLIELNDKYENNLRCTKCGFEATHVLELARHKTFAHRLNCSHCAFTTNQDHLLEKHILTHKDVKRFKCDICPYASKRKADLQAHRKRHFEDKSEYQCERCGFVTHLKSALARHKARIHKEIVLSLYS